MSLAVALAITLAGCQTTPQPDYSNTERAEPVITIDIRSLPPGAIIYANAEYVGITPLELKVVADRFGDWKQNTVIRAVVPHDTVAFEEMVYPRGYRVPSKILLRVPGYTHWYSATQQRQPTGLAVQ
jgi:hypothetical protein